MARVPSRNTHLYNSMDANNYHAEGGTHDLKALRNYLEERDINATDISIADQHDLPNDTTTAARLDEETNS